MSSNINLIDKDLIFKEDFKDLNEAFMCMSKKLLEKGLVKEGYYEALLGREKDYPTGIDLSVINKEFPNVAVPHTESKYCNTTKVIVVKLHNEIIVNNMMNNGDKLKVKYLFMILNQEGGEQSNILATIMGFVTNEKNIEKLEKAHSINDIYESVIEITL